ncbi:YdcF family protein [Pseudogemmobacter faecipullorum]|uniref:YdcF family protein n=1 Tax=Pseudogemmobacter faecipullorum TaxID=2755041 RepID=A0ABS8CJA6_9RHOB|nr:YdcF family protein [Pseudogemmobacter faecipullorum]MCB5409459.1 YdcF family protein [Pseudogemmobacter faecipullorum]
MDNLFFVISKLTWLLIQPVSWAIIAASLVLAGLLLNRRRLALWAGFTSLLLTLCFSYIAIGDRLIWQLEKHWPYPELPASVTGIIVLGGAEEAVFLPEGDPVRLNDSAERFTEGLRLAQLFPGAKLIFTGGYSDLTSRHGREGEPAALRFYRELGIAPERLVMETSARNTAENARLTRELIQPKPGETWLLVTSAFHMTRSADSFAEAGWQGILPWPVDYRASPNAIFTSDAPRNLRLTTTAIREFVGLLAYRLLKP